MKGNLEMKISIYILTALLSFSQISFAEEPQPTQEGGIQGGGGKGQAVEFAYWHEKYSKYARNLKRFFEEHRTDLQKIFPELNIDDLVKTLENLKLKMDDRQLVDRYGVSDRTCLNFREYNLIECNINKLNEISNPVVHIILLIHEVFGLLEIEESLPEDIEDIDGYRYSKKFLPFIAETKTIEYKFVINPLSLRKQFGLVIDSNWRRKKHSDILSKNCLVKHLRTNYPSEYWDKIISTLGEKGYQFYDVHLSQPGEYSTTDVEYGFDISIDVMFEFHSRNIHSMYRSTSVSMDYEFSNNIPKDRVFLFHRFRRHRFVDFDYDSSKDRDFMDKGIKSKRAERIDKRDLNWALRKIPRCLVSGSNVFH
ncbi:MAG: hypothetical protein CL678_05335 [Bdellovibrionaceae bacterium]|nr:hypothetical protein [Pseudobdellovibrionaceae bacterium]